jgi:hypothetical protein
MAVDWSQYGDGVAGTPDGEYYFLIEKAETKEAKGMNIVTAKLMILGGDFDGNGLDKTWFVKDGDSMKRFAADLKSLGFTTDVWWDTELAKTNRPAAAAKFQTYMEHALTCLAGMKFKGKKVVAKQNDKEYVNIYIESRGTDDGKPAVIDVATAKSIAEKPAF